MFTLQLPATSPLSLPVPPSFLSLPTFSISAWKVVPSHELELVQFKKKKEVEGGISVTQCNHVGISSPLGRD